MLGLSRLTGRFVDLDLYQLWDRQSLSSLLQVVIC